MIEGRCLCGDVRFEVHAPLEYAGYCHCFRCRLATGSAFATFAGVRRDALRVTDGEQSISIYRRSVGAVTHFCRTCGSVVFHVVRDGEYGHVQMGTLIGDVGISPQWHICAASKAGWHQIGDSLPQFAGLPETM
jgi:hypothetical protein